MPNKKANIFIAVAFLTITTLACNALLPLPNQTQESQGNIPQTEAEVPRVEVEAAKAALDSGQAVIVDVRSEEVYNISHIAGALHIPLGAFETDIANIDLPKEQWIITYCT